MKENDSPKLRSIFVKQDIVVYTALLAVIVFLFMFFFVFSNNKTTEGFTVSVNGKTVLTYYYNAKTVIADDTSVEIKIIDDKIYIFFDEGKKDFNELTVDLNKRTVKVTDSSCSDTKDCILEPAVGNSGAIYCAPHKLKISVLNEKENLPPITG